MILIEGIQEGRFDVAPMQRDAEGANEVLDRFDIFAQHQIALVAGGFPSYGGRDGGIAIAIGPHPGAKATEMTAWRLDFGKGLRELANQVFVEAGHGLKDHLFKVVERKVNFI